MSLTIELRDTGGGSSTTVTHVGQVVNLDVMAVVTDSANNPSADGVEDVSGDFLSTAVYDHAVAGNLQAANVAPYWRLVRRRGAQADLNGDGNLDVGINYATAPSTEGLFFARSNPIQTGESGTGTISGNSLIFEIGTLTYTVTSLNEGGETSINFSPYVHPITSPMPPVGWKMAGTTSTARFQAGTPYIVSDPNIVPAPTAVNYSQTVVKNTPTPQ